MMACFRVYAYFIFTCLIALNLPPFAAGWDSDDFELFDLVEEINRNFYDVLGVSPTTDSSELKRAYRRLSLQLHPDKNKEPDAEVKFRQLVSVYEVLKDVKKRARYDEILANGLPDWKQPVFYYRRVRKMGLLELAILLAIILTVGQFITVWSIYLERRFEKEEVFRSRKKRDKKGRRGRQVDGTDDDDATLEAELSSIRRPQMSDLLPCLFIRLAIRLLIGLPASVKTSVELVSNWWRTRCSDDGGVMADDTPDKVRTVRKKMPSAMPNVVVQTLPFELPQATDKQVTDQQETNQQATQSVDEKTTSSISRVMKDGTDWSEMEIALLAKAVARYPGGVTDRWEKISQMVGRSVREVSAMSRQVKTHCMRSVNPSTQGITADALLTAAVTDEPTTRENDYDSVIASEGEQSDRIYCEQTKSLPAVRNSSVHVPQQTSLSTNCMVTDGRVRHRHKPTTKTVDRTLMITQLVPAAASSTVAESHKSAVDVKDQKETAGTGGTAGAWSQQQQRLLEMSLNQFPKSVVDRWDRVAEMVPGKSKEECLQRFKYLAELVKKKQQEKFRMQQPITDNIQVDC
jgi:DnaJ family protein C protein 1